jgi:hypothetical protein
MGSGHRKLPRYAKITTIEPSIMELATKTKAMNRTKGDERTFLVDAFMDFLLKV